MTVSSFTRRLCTEIFSCLDDLGGQCAYNKRSHRIGFTVKDDVTATETSDAGCRYGTTSFDVTFFHNRVCFFFAASPSSMLICHLPKFFMDASYTPPQDLDVEAKLQ